MNEQYFDRIINLYLYDAKDELVGKIETPKTGRKPDLLVKGTKIANSQIIETSVLVTNLDFNVRINDIARIRASLGYAHMMYMDTLNLRVSWAEVTKTPPDKQITFHCIEANSDLVILNTPVRIQLDKPTISRALYELIVLYNDAVDRAYPSSGSSLKLDTAPDLRMDDRLLTDKFIVQGATWWDACRALEQMVAVYDDYGTPVHPFMIQASGGRLVAYVTSSSATDSLRKVTGAPIELDYVISAVRHQIVFTVKTLFDPRIRVGDVVSIPNSALVSKTSIGQQADRKVERAKFRADVRIDYAFGTVDQNSMIMLGNEVL